MNLWFSQNIVFRYDIKPRRKIPNGHLNSKVENKNDNAMSKTRYKTAEKRHKQNNKLLTEKPHLLGDLSVTC